MFAKDGYAGLLHFIRICSRWPWSCIIFFEHTAGCLREWQGFNPFANGLDQVARSCIPVQAADVLMSVFRQKRCQNIGIDIHMVQVAMATTVKMLSARQCEQSLRHREAVVDVKHAEALRDAITHDNWSAPP